MTNIKALRLFKTLYRTVEYVFANDLPTINAAKSEIRSHFNANRDLNNPKEIETAFQTGYETKTVLRRSVVQLRLVDDSIYKAQIRPEIELDDNTPFRNDITPEEYAESIKNAKKKKRSEQKMKEK